jgi:spore coat polysaccharide biosynthesis protein SpsF
MTENRRLIAALACRNQGSRLYGKPLQNLHVDTGVRIIDNVIQCLKSIKSIDGIVLAISEGSENDAFVEIARQYGIDFVIGDEHDVLARLISAGEHSPATDVFRVTSESPFLYFEEVDACWEKYSALNLDALFMEPIIDGCGFEIISLNALKTSHLNGSTKHRSEMCSLYLREHAASFKVQKVEPPKIFQRYDLRLTVDNPEDLVVCRHIYQALSQHAPRIPLHQIVDFLDRNPDLIRLVAPFAESGYKTMYL